MVQQVSEFTPMDYDDAKFSDALDEFPFFDASNSFDSEPNLSVVSDSSSDSVSKQPNHTPDPKSAGLRRRRHTRLKNSSAGVPDFDLHGSNVSHKFPLNLKNDQKYNLRKRSSSVNKVLTQEINADSSVITTVTGDESVSDPSDTSNSGSNFLFRLARLLIKAIAFQTSLLVRFAKFPMWLTYTSYKFLTDPFAFMRRAKRYIMTRITRFLSSCLDNVRWIVYQLINRNKSTGKLCLQISWGLLWAAFVGFILLGLLISAFVISGMIMRVIIEKPVQIMDQLHFDFTRNTPMAFVPIMSSCPEPFCLDCGDEINTKSGNIGELRVIPIGHKLQATVSLTLPESDYNRNLGNFQVRLDFLSANGKFLASTTQPCMLKFKSQPMRLLMTLFNLVPLITGLASESQTLNIKFKGYTEREIPTSCLRVVLEPRAEFAKTGGVPEIYTSYLNLESKLPFLKRALWSWKVTVFVWISIVTFMVGLVFMMLICKPVIVKWLQPPGVPLNNNVLR